MTIDFKTLENQDIDTSVLLEIIKAMYVEMKSKSTNNLILNEYTDNIQQTLYTDEYNLVVKESPTSINDILIISEDGTIVITPNSITGLDKNKITIKSNKIKKNMNFFITYKY